MPSRWNGAYHGYRQFQALVWLVMLLLMAFPSMPVAAGAGPLLQLSPQLATDRVRLREVRKSRALRVEQSETDGSWAPHLRLDWLISGAAGKGTRNDGTATSAAAAVSVARPLVAQVILNEERFEDAIDVFRHGDDYLIPVGDLVRMAEGEVLQEDAAGLRVRFLPRDSTLDYLAADASLRLNGRTFGPALAGVLFDQEHWYINIDIVRLLFGGDIRYDETRQQLLVQSGYPLPRDLRRARERQWARLGNKSADGTGPGRPVQQFPYAMLGPPQTDFSIAASAAGRGGGNSNWSLNSTQELGYLTSRLYLAGTQATPLAAARFTAGRTDPRGELLGADGIYDIHGGDIYAPSFPLTGGSTRNGLGVVVRAIPLEQALTFDRMVIEGDAPPEWDAELYYGGFLMAGQRVGAEGRYRFTDVPLQYGANDVKVLLHGPRGQRLSVDHPRHVDGGMVPPGKVYGQAYAFHAGTRAIRVPRAGSATAAEAEWSAGAQASVGVLPDLTVGLFAQREPGKFSVLQQDALALPQRSYFGYTASTAIGTTILNSALAKGAGASEARLGSLVTRLWGTEVSASYETFSRDFISAANLDGFGLIRDRAQLTTGFPLRFGGNRDVSLALTADTTRSWSRQQRDRLRLWASHGLYNDTFVGHELSASRNSSPDGAQPISARYGLQASTGVGESFLRGGVNVGLTGTEIGRGVVDLSLRGAKYVGYTWSFGLTQPIPKGDAAFNVSASRDLGWAAMTAGLSFTTSGGAAFMVMLNFGSFFDQAGRPHLVSRNVAESGNAVPFVFLDRDANGRYDPETDSPVPEARIRIGKRLIEDRQTDAEGRMLITGLPVFQPATIDVDEESLSDPFLGSLNRGVHIQARPGRTPEVLLPIVELGEVAGTVHRSDDSGELALSGVRLTLVGTDQHVIAETRSLNDGSFSFDRVPPGKWQVRIAPEQTLRTLIVPSLSIAVSVSPAELRRSGLRFILKVRDGRVLGETQSPRGGDPMPSPGGRDGRI